MKTFDETEQKNHFVPMEGCFGDRSSRTKQTSNGCLHFFLTPTSTRRKNKIEKKKRKERDKEQQKLAHFRWRAVAIDLPSDVLPTPGGPTRQSIEPLLSDRSDLTAMYSTILCFT